MARSDAYRSGRIRGRPPAGANSRRLSEASEKLVHVNVVAARRAHILHQSIVPEFQSHVAVRSELRLETGYPEIGRIQDPAAGNLRALWRFDVAPLFSEIRRWPRVAQILARLRKSAMSDAPALEFVFGMRVVPHAAM